MPYNTKWVWAVMNAYLPEYNTTIAFNLQDGIGSEFNPQDGNKFLEDFIMINNRHYKLDQIKIEYDEEDILKT